MKTSVREIVLLTAALVIGLFVSYAFSAEQIRFPLETSMFNGSTGLTIQSHVKPLPSDDPLVSRLHERIRAMFPADSDNKWLSKQKAYLYTLRFENHSTVPMRALLSDTQIGNDRGSCAVLYSMIGDFAVEMKAGQAVTVRYVATGEPNFTLVRMTVMTYRPSPALADPTKPGWFFAIGANGSVWLPNFLTFPMRVGITGAPLGTPPE